MQRRWWHRVKTVWRDGSWGVVWRCPQYDRIWRRMVVSSKCVQLRPKMTDRWAQFAFLGRSSARRRMTAEDKLKQLSGSGHSSMLAFRSTSS